VATAQRAPKQEIAKREQQIVALRLRHHSFTAIGRVVGISRQNAQKTYLRALHRGTDQDIQTHHRGELAELEIEAAAAWELVDAKDNPRVRASGLLALNRLEAACHCATTPRGSIGTGAKTLIHQAKANRPIGIAYRVIDRRVRDLDPDHEIISGLFVDQRRSGCERVLGIDHRVERFVINLDDIEGILRAVRIGRNDGHNRFADVADPALRQHGMKRDMFGLSDAWE
jgi:hypothetical protein